jgi:uncharacterized protein
MSKEFVASRLDVAAFAREGASLAGREPLRQRSRLLDETRGEGADLPVQWTAQGQAVAVTGGDPQVWLHLKASAVLPLTCQRCLAPVDVTLTVDRAFRFVADEATALAQDDESEEDLLVLSREFDLVELVEDELLMDQGADHGRPAEQEVSVQARHAPLAQRPDTPASPWSPPPAKPTCATTSARPAFTVAARCSRPSPKPDCRAVPPEARRYSMRSTGFCV